VSEPLKFADIAVNQRYCVRHVMGNWPRNTVYKAERPLLVIGKRVSTAEYPSPDANWPAVVLDDGSVISAVDIAAGMYEFREVEAEEKEKIRVSVPHLLHGRYYEVSKGGVPIKGGPWQYSHFRSADRDFEIVFDGLVIPLGDPDYSFRLLDAAETWEKRFRVLGEEKPAAGEGKISVPVPDLLPGRRYRVYREGRLAFAEPRKYLSIQVPSLVPTAGDYSLKFEGFTIFDGGPKWTFELAGGEAIAGREEALSKVSEGGEQMTQPGPDDMSAEAWARRVGAVVSYILGSPGEKRAEYLTLLKAQDERLYVDVRAELVRTRDAATAGRPDDYETLTFSPTTPIAAGVLEIRLNPGDLTDELWREYDFPGREKPYRIETPRALYVRPGGTTHRVVDSQGVVHCVPAPGQSGCVLRWMPRDGSKPVAF
jgi:hypothetical protein